MSTTKSSGTTISENLPDLVQFHQTAGSPWKAGDRIPAVLLDKASPWMQNRVDELFQNYGIDISLEELRELNLLENFLARHVQPNEIYDVQCMLLWSEWVRAFRNQSSGFPKLFLEKEFSSVITEKFGVVIANNSFRGTVYSGIRFVP
jgi:hypothetical protein